MTLTLHNLDGEEVRLEGTQVEYVRPARVGGKVCTRIRLSSGSDVIVSEITAEVIRRCGEDDLSDRPFGAGIEAVASHSPSGSAQTDSGPMKIKYARHRNLYHPPRSGSRKHLKVLALVVPVLVVAVAAVALIAYSQKSVSARNDLGNHERGMRAETHSAANAQTEGSAQCEPKARIRFNELVLQTGRTGAYRAHYDSNRGKCFVLVTRTRTGPKETIMSMIVLDAFTGDDYGYFKARVDKARPDSTVVPTVCEVTSVQSGQTQYCGSSEEFQSLLKPYMEEPAAPPSQ